MTDDIPPAEFSPTVGGGDEDEDDEVPLPTTTVPRPVPTTSQNIGIDSIVENQQRGILNPLMDWMFSGARYHAQELPEGSLGATSGPSEAARLRPVSDYASTVRSARSSNTARAHTEIRSEIRHVNADSGWRQNWTTRSHPRGGIMPADTFAVTPDWIQGGSLQTDACQSRDGF